jgi:hypothetical protein
MAEITDEYMKEMLGRSKQYSFVLLRAGPNRSMPGAETIVREHARRNFSLRADGRLSIVCPMTDDGPLRGIGIFTTSEEETRSIMEEDPGVRAGVFAYEIHPCRSFPGDALAG